MLKTVAQHRLAELFEGFEGGFLGEGPLATATGDKYMDSRTDMVARKSRLTPGAYRPYRRSR